jgi:mannose-1-phosphate guanylyltransferase
MSSYLVIMAGGSGTRFWPKSTSRRPKQLLAFGSDPRPLLQQTLERFGAIVPEGQKLIVTTRALGPAVTEQAPKAEILCEPQGRNTAPCVYWAARAVAARDPKGVMLVMPSDHLIARPEKFRETVERAVAWAASHDDLVTLGVKPTRPEPGYGYLRIGGSVAPGCSRVDAFVEKPSVDRAKEFLAAGNYLWNGGMFVWRAEVILAAFDRFMPEMAREWEAARGDAIAAYPKLTATSIDYGVMEKAKNVVSFPLDCGWDDIGNWTSLEDLADALNARQDENVVSTGECITVDARGNIVDAPGKLVALLGVNDLIVVEHGGAILVARKDRAQDIRAVVEQVKLRRPELA